ncbi:MAG: NYN domain-containing protein [Chloroflexi bacterium]|nr:NYN domain-containing protein [Chloroflexota bacterium]
MKISAYVDGFNLYYGCVRNTCYKWLNLATLCRLLTRGQAVQCIRYFTALVNPPTYDPDQRRRQLTFLRALKTIPNLTIHYGQFRANRVSRPLANPASGAPVMVKVLDTKEKGSDVNLATYLLFDGFRKEYEMAVIISNDADLVEPIRLVTKEMHLPVGIWHPHSLSPPWP